MQTRLTCGQTTAQRLRISDVQLPTSQAIQRDLRTIGVKGFRTALEEPLPALLSLPSVQQTIAAGRQSGKEIECLIRSGLRQLEQRLGDAGAQYLLGRQEHKERTEHAAQAWRAASSPKSFRRIRNERLEPQLARALLSLAEQEQPGRDSATASTATDLSLEQEPPLHELFVACPEGEAAKDRELAAIAARNGSVWWHNPSSGWFGSYFAFWCKVGTFPCDEMMLVVDQGLYGAQRFGVKPKWDGPKDKLTIVSASWFSTDASDNEIHCGVTNYGFAFKWAKDHVEELLSSRVSPSVFGADDRPAYPGIAGVHTLIQTADGFVLFALRNDTTVTYHQLTWSASFEESITYDRDDQDACDKTVLDTIVRGLRDEWGIPASAIEASTVLAIGREFVRIDEKRLDLSASILTVIRLNADLDTVWKWLARRLEIPDIDEHRAWAAVPFTSRKDLLQLLRFARDRTQGRNLFHEFADSYPSAGEIVSYPGGPTTDVEDRGLMPTSAARLYLGSRWLSQC